MPERGGESALLEQSASELVRQLSEQTAALARREVELAKAELAIKGKRAGVGGGDVRRRGLFGLYALGALTQWVSPGGVAGVPLWLIASAAFAVYVATFASYNKTYGALGAVIVFLVWLWISNHRDPPRSRIQR